MQRSWVPTRISLRCDVKVGGQTFWKADEATVVKLDDDGISVHVVMKGRPIVLKRSQYNIVSRKRLNNGNDTKNGS